MTQTPIANSTVSSRASRRSTAPLKAWKKRDEVRSPGEGSMNWAAFTIPKGISRIHRAWVQDPDVQRPQWNASTTWPSGPRTSRPWASVGRKQRLRSSPATWQTCALASIASGGVPLTPCTRSSTQLDMPAPPPRRGPCHMRGWAPGLRA